MTDRQRSDSIGRTVLQTVAQNVGPIVSLEGLKVGTSSLVCRLILTRTGANR